MVQFVDTEEPVTLPEIERLEKLIGYSFPAEYKEHVLKYNGGRCIPDAYSFIENGRLEWSNVAWFFEINSKIKWSMETSIHALKTEDKRMPDRMLPIAHDSGGNIICISCSGVDLGYIYFWDHEMEVDYSEEEDSVQSNMYLIAKSFTEFIDGLSIFPDPE